MQCGLLRVSTVLLFVLCSMFAQLLTCAMLLCVDPTPLRGSHHVQSYHAISRGVPHFDAKLKDFVDKVFRYGVMLHYAPGLSLNKQEKSIFMDWLALVVAKLPQGDFGAFSRRPAIRRRLAAKMSRKITNTKKKLVMTPKKKKKAPHAKGASAPTMV